MGLEKVKTAKGTKLRDSKTKKLAGSLPSKGKKAPTAKSVLASSNPVATTDTAEVPAKKVKKYGSRTKEITAVLKQMETLTPEQDQQLTRAYRTFNIDPEHRHLFSKKHSEAFEARSKAVRKAKKLGLDPLPGYNAVFAEAKKRVWGDTSSRFRDDVWSDSKSVQRDTLVALLAYDLIGPKVFTQAHFDSIVEPWESVFGKIKIKK